MTDKPLLVSAILLGAAALVTSRRVPLNEDKDAGGLVALLALVAVLVVVLSP